MCKPTISIPLVCVMFFILDEIPRADDSVSPVPIARKVSIKSKHLIFLGAGASCSAGYPLAGELANKMNLSSVKSGIKQALSSRASSRPLLYEQQIEPFCQGFESDLRLFKESRCETVDEFGSLARQGRYAGAVQRLKLLLRLYLALPSLDCTTRQDDGDYLRFSRKLLGKGGTTLRDDVVVLTFNYDPFFEYLLEGLFSSRSDLTQQAGPLRIDTVQTDAIYSGFCAPGEVSWQKGERLRILKLHGSIVYPWQRTEGSAVIQGEVPVRCLFNGDTHEVIEKLCSNNAEPPPLIFPYEIVTHEGQLVGKADFPLKERTPWRRDDYGFYDLFKDIWARAKLEVEAAYKISFIGLSMSDLMRPAMLYLFREKEGPVEVVVANPSNQAFANADSAGSPCRRVHTLLMEATGAKIEIKHSGAERRLSGERADTPTPRNSFSDFIENEL